MPNRTDHALSRNGFVDALIKMIVGAIIGIVIFVATGYMDYKARIAAIESWQTGVDRQLDTIRGALIRMEGKIDRLQSEAGRK